MSAIDEIKQRLDIVDIIGDYIQLQKAGRNLKALCPFHSEKHASFYVFPEKQTWHCFGACGTGGDIFSFIMKKENIGFSETLQLLANRAGVSLDSGRENRVDSDKKNRLFQINEMACEHYHHLLLNSDAA